MDFHWTRNSWIPREGLFNPALTNPANLS